MTVNDSKVAISTPIIIAGGGPVGMATALFLAHYGVASVLLERNPETTCHPKMDLTNGRSMELIHKLGLAEKFRDAGVPRDQGFDVAWFTNMAGHELHRFSYASPIEQAKQSAQINDGSFTREAPLRVSQIQIEPVLKVAIDENPLIDVRFNTKFEEIISRDDKCVRVAALDNNTGETLLIEGQYLVGTDGGGSRVRRQLGIDLDGDMAVAGAYMVHFHSEDASIFGRWAPTYHYQNAGGTIIAQNGKDTWTLQRWLMPDENPDDMTAEGVLEEWVGASFDYDIIQANPWEANLVVAQKYVDGRVVLAGDAAHQYIPTGGYGMNSGVADAAGVSWVLAALVLGWGGKGLLAAYELERKTTDWTHLEAAKRHFLVRQQIGEVYLAAGAMSTDEERQAAGKKIADIGNAENESWGVEHGYRYDSSPIIAHGDEAPDIDPLVYTPNTIPGARLPHVFLEKGVSIFDMLGQFFTLISFNETDTLALEKAAEALSIPLKILRLNYPNHRVIYEQDLLLVRPDQHIAWRGDALPDNTEGLIALVSGQ